ncbi:MAG: GNAT family N-acetyltransferase [Flavobacteriales bacterium]|nr:GNAT family N-acetyltransferase [Flavobacteriales bacterium]
MTKQIQIRNIEEADASRIAELNQELGYQTSPSLVERQLKTILSERNHHGYVAINDNQIVGYIHGFISIRLTTEPFAEIGGLIVNEDFRNRGIGRQLVDHFEKQIKDVENIRVRCNVNRNPAHKFYLTLNYIEKKEQKIFEKKLHTTKPKLH